MNLFEIYESMGKLDNKEIIAVITKGANILGEREFSSKKTNQPIVLHAFGEKPKVVEIGGSEQESLDTINDMVKASFADIAMLLKRGNYEEAISSSEKWSKRTWFK